MGSNDFDAKIALVLLGIITAYLSVVSDKIGRFIQLLSYKGYIIEVMIIAFWSVAILKFDGFNIFPKSSITLMQLKRATIQGIIAFIIAILAYVGLTTPAFWFVVIIGYYIDTPITGVY